MIASLVNRLNAVSIDWAHYMIGALIDASIGLALVVGIWFVARRHLAARWCYLLFLLVPLKILLPIEAPILPARTNPVDGPSATAADGSIDAWSGPQRTPTRARVLDDSAAERRDRRRQATVESVNRTTNARSGRATAMPTATTLLMIGWGAIVAALVLRFAMNQLTWRRLVRQATPVSIDTYGIDWQEFCRKIGVRRAVAVQISEAIDIPAVFGLGRSRIILPKRLLATLGPRQLECVLAHELAHLKWHDLWVAAAERVVRMIHFANPAIWLAAHFAHIHREIACDDASLAAANMDRKTCGGTLLQVLEFAHGNDRFAPPAMAMSGQTRFYSRRLRRIMCAKPPSSKFNGWNLTGLLLAIVLIVPNLRAAAPSAPAADPMTPYQPEQSDDTSNAANTFPSDELVEIDGGGPLVRRSYDVGDLINTGTDPDTLVELITSITPHVGNAGWDEVGGPATIAFDADKNRLIVSQVESMHQGIKRLLDEFLAIAKVKQARDAAVPPPAPRRVGLFKRAGAGFGQITMIHVIPSLLYIDPKRNDPLYADYDTIIELITSFIDPDTWDAVGGPGSLEAWPGGEAIAVTQSGENHAKIEQLLKLLHRFPSVLSGKSPPSLESVSAGKREAIFVLPDRKSTKYNLETRVYPMLDMLPADTKPEFRLSPRGIGLEQLVFSLMKTLLPAETFVPVETRTFHTKGLILISTTAEVHQLATDELARMRGRLKNAATPEQQRSVMNDLFPPAFRAGYGWAEMTPNHIYLHGECEADEQLKRLGPLATRLKVQLIDTDISQAGLARIPDLGTIHQLTVRSRDLGPDDLKTIAEYGDLAILNLKGTRVTDDVVAAFKTLPRLQNLNLHGTGITDRAAASLALMPTIWFLDLSNTSLSDKGLSELFGGELGKMGLFLNLSNTKITREAIDSLRETHPRVHVQFPRSAK